MQHICEEKDCPSYGQPTSKGCRCHKAPMVMLAEENTRLRDALNGLMKLIDDGTLVRDISNDAKPDWALAQIGLVMTLKTAHTALGRT